MHITAKSDYAVRAVLSLAHHEALLADEGVTEEPVVKIGVICEEQGLPRKFLEGILGDLRRAGIVRTRRGGNGGYGLARPADQITLGAVLRAVDGPLAEVRGLRPHETSYSGAAEHLPEVRRRVVEDLALPRCGWPCVTRSARSWTRRRSPRCSPGSSPPPSRRWSRPTTPGRRAELTVRSAERR